jgi:hypothetical protein
MESKDFDFQSRGIDEAKAADLRARLKTFAELFAARFIPSKIAKNQLSCATQL